MSWKKSSLWWWLLWCICKLKTSTSLQEFQEFTQIFAILHTHGSQSMCVLDVDFLFSLFASSPYINLSHLPLFRPRAHEALLSLQFILRFHDVPWKLILLYSWGARNPKLSLHVFQYLRQAPFWFKWLVQNSKNKQAKKGESVTTWVAFTLLSWAALMCSLCLTWSEAVIGAAQDLLTLMESSTDDNTSCSLVHTTPPPPSDENV